MAEHVFLYHSAEDRKQVRDLYRRLEQDGLRPWLDEEDILGGQNWQHEVLRAIRESRYVLVCLSKGAVRKRSFVRKELEVALGIADDQPEGSVFLIPVRLEPCKIPHRIRAWHCVDLFETNGYERLLRSLGQQRPTGPPASETGPMHLPGHGTPPGPPEPIAKPEIDKATSRPSPDNGPVDQPDPNRSRWRNPIKKITRGLRGRPRRALVAVGVLVGLAGLAGGAILLAVLVGPSPPPPPPCPVTPDAWTGTAAPPVSLERVGNACIGFSDGRFRFGSGAGDPDTSAETPEDRLRRDLDLLYRLNQCAEKLHADHPGVPFRTIVLLEAFSKPAGPGEEWATAKSQTLEGILTWMLHLDGTPPTGPGSPASYTAASGAPDPVCAAAPPSENPMLLRVLVANAGVGMAHALEVVENHITPLAERDPSVAGVIGLDRSTKETIMAIERLGSIPLPTVGVTLTADGLEENHEYYVQLVPSNKEQMDLVLHFAAEEGRDTVRVYYPGPRGASTDGHDWTDELPDPAEAYLHTMIEDFRDAESAEKYSSTKIERIGWSPGENIEEWAGRRCDELKRDEKALGFFVGRADDFEKFFEGMRGCADRLLANDAVTEYVAGYVAGSETGGNSVVRFVSLGATVVTAGSACAYGTIREGDLAEPGLVAFCKRLVDVHEIIEKSYGIPRTRYLETKWVGEYVGLTYDAVNIFYATAADHGGSTPASVDRRKVRDAILAATFEGATSPRWDYRKNQIPREKLLMILSIDLQWRELPTPGRYDAEPCLYVSYAGTFEPCLDLVARLHQDN